VAAVFAELPGGDIRLIAFSGADIEDARRVARQAVQGGNTARVRSSWKPIGREPDGRTPRRARHAAPLAIRKSVVCA
jgi:hypothetical protein